jgi:hypothetical protein
MNDGADKTIADTHQKALEINLDPTSFGSFAEIGAGQEVARWFLHVGAASGTVAKTVSAYDKEVSDQIYGSGTRYVSRQRLEAMLVHEWPALLQQVADARRNQTRFFTFANTIAARNFAGTNDCHGWIGLRFQDQPRAEANDILLHINLRDSRNLLQQEAVGILGVNLLHAVLKARVATSDLPGRILENISNDRVEIDQIVMRGSAFSRCDTWTLHAALARDGQAEAVTLDEDGVAHAANEFLYKKSLVLIPSADDPRDDLSSHSTAACVEKLRHDVAGNKDVKDVLNLRLMVVDSEAPLRALGNGAVMLTRHRPLYQATAFVRRYTQAPLRFAISLPALVRIFDDAEYQHLDGRLLEGISRLFGSDVCVLAFPCLRDDLLNLLDTKPARRWEIEGNGQWITAGELRPPLPLRHLYEYILACGFLVSMPHD